MSIATFNQADSVEPRDPGAQDIAWTPLPPDSAITTNVVPAAIPWHDVGVEMIVGGGPFGGFVNFANVEDFEGALVSYTWGGDETAAAVPLSREVVADPTFGFRLFFTDDDGLVTDYIDFTFFVGTSSGTVDEVLPADAIITGASLTLTVTAANQLLLTDPLLTVYYTLPPSGPSTRRKVKRMDTVARPYEKARLANSSSANFPSWVTSEFLAESQFTDPGTAAGRVVKRLSVGGGAGTIPCAIQVMPYGLGSDNDVFSMRLVGLRRIAQPIADGRCQFVREKIAVLACTISAAVGLAGGQVINTERFADTISITFEATYTADTTRAGTIMLYSPADDTPANAIVPLVGYEAVEIEWDQTTGTPTMNALVTFLSGDRY